MRLEIKKFIAILIHIVVCISIVGIFISTDSIKQVSVITLGILVYAIFIYNLVEINILSFSFIFTMCLMLFNFGQSWLFALGINTTRLSGYSDVFLMFEESNLIQVLRFTSILVLVTIGINIIFNIPLEEASSPKMTVCNFNLRNKILLVLFFVIVISSNIIRGFSVQIYGYAQGFIFKNKIFYYLNELIIPVSIYLLEKAKNSKRYQKIIYFLVIINEVIILFWVGNRGASVIRILVIGLYYYNTIAKKGISKKQKSIFLISITTIILLMPFISATRTNLLEINFIEFLIKENAFVIFLSEFGSTLSTACYANTAFNLGFASNGMQIINCILSIFPRSSMFFQNIGKNIEFAAILNKDFGIRGLGGSLVGEFLYNFGEAFIGIVIFGIIYIILLKILKKCIKSKKYQMYRNVFIYQIIFAMFTWIRGSLYDLLTSIKIGVYFIIIIFLFKNIIKKEKRKQI